MLEWLKHLGRRRRCRGPRQSPVGQVLIGAVGVVVVAAAAAVGSTLRIDAMGLAVAWTHTEVSSTRSPRQG